MSDDPVRFEWLEPARAQACSSVPRQGHQAPSDAASYFAAAEKMRRAGHFEAAATLYDRALGFDPHCYSVGNALVDSLIRGGLFDEADRRSHELLEAFRQVRTYYAARASALVHCGEIEQALPLATIAIEGEKSWYGECVYAEVLLKHDKKNLELALKHLERAVDAAPGEWEPHFVSGCILLEAGWPALAAGHFSEAAHWAPDAPASWLCLGDCFFSLRLYDQALFYYQIVITLEPTHETALERQRHCSSRSMRLLRFLQRDKLMERWENHIKRLRNEWEKPKDVF